MIVRVKSETATVIELEWDPVGGQEGYVPTIDSSVILTDGKRHPSTKQNATTVKIAKVLDGKPHAYGVNILGVVQQGSVTVGGPPPPPPPPPPPATARIFGCGIQTSSLANYAIRHGSTLRAEFDGDGIGGEVDTVGFYLVYRIVGPGQYAEGDGGQVLTTLFADGKQIGQPYLIKKPMELRPNGAFPQVPTGGVISASAKRISVQWTNPVTSGHVSLNNMAGSSSSPACLLNHLGFYDGSGPARSDRIPIVQVKFKDGRVIGGCGYVDGKTVSGSVTQEYDLAAPRTFTQLHACCSGSSIQASGPGGAHGSGPISGAWTTISFPVTLPSGRSRVTVTGFNSMRTHQNGSDYGLADAFPEGVGSYVPAFYLT